MLFRAKNDQAINIFPFSTTIYTSTLKQCSLRGQVRSISTQCERAILFHHTEDTVWMYTHAHLYYQPIGRSLCRRCSSLPPWSSTQRLYGQQAETLIPVMDTWLTLSPGTAAGQGRHWDQGKTEAAGVAPDSCPCCATINPFQAAASFLLLCIKKKAELVGHSSEGWQHSPVVRGP